MTRSTVATIDLDALAANLAQIRLQAPAAAVLAMVKANAYGHGMVPIARVLQHLGVDMLGVAFVDEAALLRSHGISIPITVLTPIEPEEAGLAIELGVTAVVCDLEHARWLSHAAVASQRQIGVHIYVDTGMHREGFSPLQVPGSAEVIRKLPGLYLDGICTHFATSDDPQSTFLEHQLSTFAHVVEECSSLGITFANIHAANTGAIWRSAQTHFTMIRPGLSLYGYSAHPADNAALRPAMSVTSRIVSMRRIRAGESVSYGRRFVAESDTTIATIPIGYGDGYQRRLTGKAWCIVGETLYPVVGTVCMDEIMVDVGDAPVSLGDKVILIGSSEKGLNATSITAVTLAEWADTIPYDITTGISQRVPRVYVGAKHLVDLVNVDSSHV